MAHVFRTVFTVNSLALCLLVSLCGQALALDLTATAFPDETEISAQILPLLKDDAYVGIVVGIVRPKERRIFGFGSLNRHRVEKPDGDTVYPIASVTKTFTGALLADLVLRGIVQLDDPIFRYLPPEILKPGGSLSGITLLDLATHTSGLPKMPNNMTSTPPGKEVKPYSVNQLYDFLGYYRLTHTPGLDFQYSNIGVALLGHILEIASRLPYEKLVEDRICRPLGMSSTRITPGELMRARLAEGYDKNLRPVKLQKYAVGMGSGGLYSTGNDMVRYLVANLGMSEADIVPVLLYAQKPQRPIPGKKAESIGLTWHINKVKGRDVVSKNGGIVGFQSFMAFSRADKVGIIVLANGNPQNRALDATARRILRQMLPAQ